MYKSILILLLIIKSITMNNKLYSTLECSKCYETMYPIKSIKRSVNSQIVRYCCNSCGKCKSILKTIVKRF